MKKMHRFLKINCIMMALVLVFALTGCGAEPSLLRYDLSGGVTSLDPQFADGESEQLVIYNMMEGLMRQLPSGELENGVITGYEVSEDQTVYTFSLKEGMVWDDSEFLIISTLPRLLRCIHPFITARRFCPDRLRQKNWV